MKYFGTDGFRGKANETLTAQQAFIVGSSFGQQLKEKFNQEKLMVYIGKDTRLSSDMLESALASGFASSGIEVHLLGIIPTPTVSYITKNSDAVGAVMISASHNPYYDNGLKLFNDQGEKMDPKTEEAIERVLDDPSLIELCDSDAIGKIKMDKKAIDSYLNYLEENVPVDLKGYKVILDCANGASVTTAVKAFEKTGADLIVLHQEPDGYNINTKCGSTHPESLQEAVKEHKADFGFAFDGDADRCIAVNEKGELFDGDHMLYSLGKFMKDKGTLNNNVIVTTVMANLGFFRAIEKLDIDSEKTAVGDKYVYEALNKRSGSIGGEQSGHIIFKEIANTGDGVLTALKLSEMVKETGQTLSESSKDCVIYPQTLKNIRVIDKEAALTNETILAEVNKVQEHLGSDGRILVRPSGTEPLIRVMVEAQTQEECDKCVDQVIEVIEQLGV